MRERLILGSVLAVVLPLTARAQPPHSQPVPTAPATEESKWRLEGGMLIGTPRGGLDQENASGGLELVFGRTVARHVSLFAGLRYIKISSEREYNGSKYVLRHHDVHAGVRYSRPVSPSLDVFGEAHVSLARFAIGHPEFAGGTTDPVSHSGAGVGLRAGVIAAMADALGIGGAIGYSRASLERGANLGTRFGDDDTTIVDSWLTFELVARVAF